MSEPLVDFFALSSSVFAFFALVELLRTRSAARTWGYGWLDDTRVRISENFGPATFGFFKPEVVVPRWLLVSDLGTAQK